MFRRILAAALIAASLTARGQRHPGAPLISMAATAIRGTAIYGATSRI